MQPPYERHYQEIRYRIGNLYRMVVSPETLIELMDTLKGGTGEYFDIDKRRLKIMAGKEGDGYFLPFPGEFALRKSLGLSVPATFSPNAFKRWYRLITSASTRYELFEAGIKRGDKTTTFDPDVIVQQQKAGKQSYREWLQTAVTGAYAFPPPERWAMAFAKELGYDISSEQATTLASDLSAAYEFRKSIFTSASANKNFNSDKRDGDWVDGQQLIYLCDPTIHIVTEESSIREKCSDSPQRHRVLILKEFIKDLGVSV